MMKIVLGALALTAATTPALATETSWSTTDRDLASLSSSLTQGASGVSVSGFLRSSYVNNSDADISGFSIDDAQIWVNGTVGNFGVVVQTEASNGNNQPGSIGVVGDLNVKDAYVSWSATEMINVQMGQFRPAFLASSARNENNLLFISRSQLGEAFAYRAQGVQAGASFGMINVAVYAQNGENQGAAGLAGDDLSFGLRASAQIMGTAAANEGALGASGDPSLTVGLGYMDDKSSSTLVAGLEECLAIDATFTMGALGVSAEIVDISAAAAANERTPFNVAGSFVVMPDQLELGLRYEDFDDAANTNWITVGANWYLQGHAAKWQVNFITADSDAAANELDMFQVGLTVSM